MEKPKFKLSEVFGLFIICFFIASISAFLTDGFTIKQAFYISIFLSFVFEAIIYLDKRIKRLKWLKAEFERKKQEDIERKKRERFANIERKKRERFAKQQMDKGLIEYDGKWLKPKDVKKFKEIDLGIDSDFMNMSHFQFEHFIAKLFGHMGYKTRVTKKTGDYGGDVIAIKGDEKILIQTKQYKKGHNISNVEVRHTLGGMWKYGCDKAVLITTSDFTLQAEEQAKNSPIELWNLRILKDFVRKYMIDKVIEEKIKKSDSSY